jgi:ankyrin repeat protein
MKGPTLLLFAFAVCLRIEATAAQCPVTDELSRGPFSDQANKPQGSVSLISLPPMPHFSTGPAPTMPENLRPDEQREWTLRRAIETSDLTSFEATLPVAEPARTQWLRRVNALAHAYTYGALSIATAIKQSNPRELDRLIADPSTGLIRSAIVRWRNPSYQSISEQRRAEMVSEYANLIGALLKSAKITQRPQELSEALAEMMYVPASEQQWSFAERLIDLGANPNHKVNKQSLLALSVEQSQTRTTLKLLEAPEITQDTLDESLAYLKYNTDVEVLELLLKRGANPNLDATRFGREGVFFPMYIAARAFATYGLRKPMDAMIQRRVDPNRFPPDTKSPLMLVMHDHVFMSGLISLGADVNFKTKHGDTALHAATRRPFFVERYVDASRLEGHSVPADGLAQSAFASVKLLLDAGADPNVANSRGVTPLMQTGRFDGDTVRLLASKGASFNSQVYVAETTDRDSQRPMGVATAALLNGNDALAAVMLKRQSFDPSADCGAIYYAAMTGATETLALLLKNRTAHHDVDSPEGKSALHVAAAKGQLAAVRMLLDAKEFDVEVTTPVKVRGCQTEWFSGLTPCFYGGWTPLMFAARGGHKEVVSELIARGASMSRKDATGKSVTEIVRTHRSP